MSTRREVFFGGLVIGQAALLAACSNSAPPHENQTAGETQSTPEPNTWSVIEIPSGDFLANIENVEYQQRPDIGLKGLFLVGQRGIAAVGIASFWSLAELEKTTPQKFGTRIGTARVGFQEVGDKFTPDVKKLPATNTNNIAYATAQRFTGFVTSTLSEEAGNRKDQIMMAQIVPLPSIGKNYAVVIDSGYFPFNGQRNPRSFISIKFRFTSQPLPGPNPNTNPSVIPTPRTSGNVA